MRYLSTRDNTVRVTAAEAIAKGLAGDGGLFVPEVIPQLPAGAMEKLCEMNYRQRAVYVMEMYLDGYTAAELSDFTERAYSPKGFDTPEIAPVVTMDDKTHVLELWHDYRNSAQTKHLASTELYQYLKVQYSD